MFRTTLFAAAAAFALTTSAFAEHRFPGPADEPVELEPGEVVAIEQAYITFTSNAMVRQIIAFSSDDPDGVTNFLSDDFMAGQTPFIPNLEAAWLAGQMNYRGLHVVGSLSSGATGPFSTPRPSTSLHVYITENSDVTFADLFEDHLPLGYDDEAAGSDGFYSESLPDCGGFYWGYKGEATPFPPGPIGPVNRDAVYGLYRDSLEQGALGVCLQHISAAHSAVDPVVGNPESLQGSMLRSALELGGGENPFLAEPELLGFAVTRFDAGAFQGERYDLRLQHGWALGGGGMRLLVDLPLSLIDNGDDTAFAGHVGVGLEVPLIADRWTLTPRTSFGIVSSDETGGDGELWSASLASRYLLSDVGGGKLVIGNMAAYTATTETGFSGSNLNPDLSNWAFRNGLAYQLPGGDWRAAYVFTTFTGDDVFLDEYHEVSVDYDGFEKVRVGLKATAGDDYEAVTLSAGLRF